jgi:tetratricopeptide (TPR) repeat protein
VAQEQREFEEARKNYNKALEIFIEFNDRYSQAKTYHQLGMVAEEQWEFEEARKNYNKALEIFIEFDDRYSLEIVSGSLK